MRMSFANNSDLVLQYVLKPFQQKNKTKHKAQYSPDVVRQCRF